MLDSALVALANITSGVHLLYLLGGVFLGLAVGIFPGLGGIVGLSLLLPFLYGMDPTSALAMLIGLVVVIPTSDTFTSVLMGIPGSSASQATVLDGFPLAKKGEAARALGAAFSASLFGGLLGALILTAFVLVARPVILLFGSAELFMLTVLGLSMVGVMAGSSIVKGLTACGVGLLLGGVGGAPATGEYRMIFDLDYLTDGVPLVVVGLGIFAIPEIVDLLRQNRSIAGGAALGKGWLDGLRDMIRNKWLCVRCAGIGSMVGALPGLGGSVVDWIAYGHVVQTAKDKSQFGKGDIRGVLAPESANNAKEGGGLIPTLLFGVPGSGSMAVFLGGMVLIGLEPGPSMVEDNLDITYTIIWSLALANVIGAGTCLLISKHVAKLTTIRYPLMAPFMIMVICFGAFQATRDLGDLVALFAIGLLGILMKRFGWPRPALLIGFVLSGQMETYLYQALQFYEWGFLARPGVIIIGLLTLASVVLGAVYGQRGTDEAQARHAADRRPQIIFAGFLLIAFAYGLYDAFEHSYLGGVYTGSVCAVMLVLGAWVLYDLTLAPVSSAANHDEELGSEPGSRDGLLGLGHYIYWLAGLLAAIFVIGYLLALTAFFLIFLRVKGGISWARTALLTAFGIGFLVFLAHIMVLDFPRGLLQEAVELPWPIG